MAEVALINIDKREVIEPSVTAGDYGYKAIEAIMNYMPPDVVWLFAVPADGQPVPAPPAAKPNSFAREIPPQRVPVGHWAGDRVLLADEDCGSAKDYLPADVLAAFPDADTDESVFEFAVEHFTPVSLPGYAHAGTADSLFPATSVWVVRNLTKRWFARADVLVKEKYRRGPDVSGGLGLGEFIWAETGGAMSTWMDKGTGMGDRFDVQPLAAVEDGTQWVDRSKEAKRCLKAFEEDFEVDQYRDY
ncbi:hypothetical protein DFH09DRAFT_1317765 [Mycena vulgaris]|nr:hypothetical protein DFH09DRAFT_1317765 [Mycena vulgaris]